MTVKELIEKLLEYNMDAKVSVCVHNHGEDFSIAFGGSEGVTKKNCEGVSLYVDRLNQGENIR